MKKRLSVLIALTMLFGTLVGCEGRNGIDSAPGQRTGERKVQLKLVQYKVETTDKVKVMVADYMAENPNVEIETSISSDYDALLKTSFSIGDAPDIFMMRAGNELAAWNEKLADLSDEPWMAQVSPAAVQGMKVDGKKLGFPIAFEGYGYIYNKDLFRKAGIDKLPNTLTELKHAHEKLKAAGIPSFSEAYKEWWTLGQHLFNLPFAYESDPSAAIEKINNGNMKIKDIVNMDGFFKLLDMSLQYGKGAESIGISYDNQVADFASGKTAMMLQGVWAIDPIMKINPDIRMGMFAIPLTDNASETKLPVGVPGYYVINKDSKQLEEAKKFLTWIHKNGQKYLVDSFKFIPAFTNLKTTPELGPLAEDMSKYVEENKTLPWTFDQWPTGANQEMIKPLQAYVGGMIDKKKALEEAQKIWEERLEQ